MARQYDTNQGPICQQWFNSMIREWVSLRRLIIDNVHKRSSSLPDELWRTYYEYSRTSYTPRPTLQWPIRMSFSDVVDTMKIWQKCMDLSELSLPKLWRVTLREETVRSVGRYVSELLRETVKPAPSMASLLNSRSLCVWTSALTCHYRISHSASRVQDQCARSSGHGSGSTQSRMAVGVLNHNVSRPCWANGGVF